MKLFRNKQFFLLAFFAACLLLAISVGGEFLHARIHHHINQQDHDRCPLVGLMNQVFIVVAAIGFVLACTFLLNSFVLPSIFVLTFSFNCPSLRAPPLV